MTEYCDRCDAEVPRTVHVHCPDFFSGHKPLDRKLCPECANRLYHWFKMECNRYGCDELE